MSQHIVLQWSKKQKYMVPTYLGALVTGLYEPFSQHRAGRAAGGEPSLREQSSRCYERRKDGWVSLHFQFNDYNHPIYNRKQTPFFALREELTVAKWLPENLIDHPHPHGQMPIISGPKFNSIITAFHPFPFRTKALTWQLVNGSGMNTMRANEGPWVPVWQEHQHGSTQ